jgi:hypothetical protein
MVFVACWILQAPHPCIRMSSVSDPYTLWHTSQPVTYTVHHHICFIHFPWKKRRTKAELRLSELEGIGPARLVSSTDHARNPHTRMHMRKTLHACSLRLAANLLHTASRSQQPRRVSQQPSHCCRFQSLSSSA